MFTYFKFKVINIVTFILIFRFELKAYCSAPSRVHTTSSTPESWMSRTLTRKTSRREYIRNLKQKDERSHRISFRALVPRTSQCIEAHSSAHQSSASVLVFLLTREPCPSTLAQLPQVVHENRARLLAGSFEGVVTARALQHKLRRGGGGGGAHRYQQRATKNPIFWVLGLTSG